MMDWSAENGHKDFIRFKSSKMWLETKGVPDHKQYMFILQLVGEEGLHHWQSFPLAVLNNDDME